MVACALVDWLNVNAGAVTGLSTLVLVCLTGWYGWNVHRELTMLKGQPLLQAKQAVRGIVIEIAVNNKIARDSIDEGTSRERTLRTPFLDTAYESFFWALSGALSAPETYKAIVDACVSIKRFNAYFEADIQSQDIPRKAAFAGAVLALDDAMKAIMSDKNFMEWLGPPVVLGE